MKFFVPPNHPRAESLYTRELLVHGFEKGLVVPEGLIAHGRGEAFDYLLGERTTDVACIAAQSACACLLLSSYPVISVNGNVAALCAKDIAKLSRITGAAVEVNLFYRTKQRELLIQRELENNGVNKVFGIQSTERESIPGLKSQRRHIDRGGIYKADTILVPLEDGDRAESLVNMGKTIISIDLNPLSRTSKVAQISIIDNITRALPAMISITKRFKLRKTQLEMKRILKKFDNKKNLSESLKIIKAGNI